MWLDRAVTANIERTNEEVFTGVRRQLRALSERVGASDGEALQEMVKLRDELELHIEDAVCGQRHNPDLPASWADIGWALGVTRQMAHKRYKHVGGLRQAMGQPSAWR